MKDIRCLFGRHKFTDWFEVGNHLERECPRCGKAEAKYPNPIVMLASLASKVLLKSLEIRQTYPVIFRDTAFPVKERK